MPNKAKRVAATRLKLPGFASGVATACLMLLGTSALSQEVANENNETPAVAEAPQKATKEPVFRVSKLNRDEPTPTPTPAALASSVSATSPDSIASLSRKSLLPHSVTTPESGPSQRNLTAKPHPLDKAIEMAVSGLAQMRANVSDYSAIMVKRERVNGVVGSPSYMKLKIRCPRKTETSETPFSVYMKFLKPRKVSGREVIWVDGQNDGKLCVHESGIMGMKRFYLEPTGWLAMQNNRYPVYDAGIENLMIKLIERAERDKAAGDCKVDYHQGVELMKRECSMIELMHEEKRAPFDFYKAQVFIDKELNMPVRFVSYDWPVAPGAKPEIIEEYTYVKISLNQGFTNSDFSPDNPQYNFPSR